MASASEPVKNEEAKIFPEKTEPKQNPTFLENLPSAFVFGNSAGSRAVPIIINGNLGFALQENFVAASPFNVGSCFSIPGQSRNPEYNIVQTVSIPPNVTDLNAEQKVNRSEPMSEVGDRERGVKKLQKKKKRRRKRSSSTSSSEDGGSDEEESLTSDDLSDDRRRKLKSRRKKSKKSKRKKLEDESDDNPKRREKERCQY